MAAFPDNHKRRREEEYEEEEGEKEEDDEGAGEGKKEEEQETAGEEDGEGEEEEEEVKEEKEEKEEKGGAGGDDDDKEVAAEVAVVVRASLKKKSKKSKKKRIEDEEDEEDVKRPESPTPPSSSSSGKLRPPYEFATGLVFDHKLAGDWETIVHEESLKVLATRDDLDGYVQVNPDQIAYVTGMCRTDHNIGTAASFLLRRILAGNIEFKRGAGEHDEYPSHDEARYQSTVWSEFAHKLHHALWEYGFAAISWIPDRRYYGRPVVVPLTGLNVYFHTNVYGQTAWVYQRKGARLGGGRGRGINTPSSSATSSSSAMNPVTSHVRRILKSTGNSVDVDGILPNIMTVCTSLPSPDGSLRSLVITTLPDAAFAEIRKHLLLKAETARAAPAWFSEEAKTASKYNEESVPLPGESNRKTSRAERKGGGGGGGGDSDDSIDRVIQEVSRTKGSGMAAMAKAILSGGALSPDDSTVPTSSHIGVGDCVRVGDGRISRSASLAEPPSDYLKMLIHHETRVNMAFGIPGGVLQTENASGRSSVNENAEKVLHHTVRMEKQRTLQIFYDVWHFIHDDARIMQAVERTPITHKLTDDDVRRVTGITILLPGIPDDLKMKEHYEMGIITPDGYKRHVVANDSLDPHDLASDIKPPQTEYEAPPVPGVGGAGGAKKTKKKKKSPAAKKKKKTTQKKKKAKPKAKS